MAKKKIIVVVVLIVIVAISVTVIAVSKNDNDSNTNSSTSSQTVTKENVTEEDEGIINVASYFSFLVPSSWEGKYDFHYDESENNGWCFIYETLDHNEEVQSDTLGLVGELYWCLTSVDYDYFYEDSYWKDNTYIGVLKTPNGSYHLYLGNSLIEDASYSKENEKLYKSMVKEVKSFVLPSIEANNDCVLERKSFPSKVDDVQIIDDIPHINVSSNILGLSVSEYVNKFSLDSQILPASSSNLNTLRYIGCPVDDIKGYVNFHMNSGVGSMKYYISNNNKVVYCYRDTVGMMFEELGLGQAYYDVSPKVIKGDKSYVHLLWRLDNGYIDVCVFNYQLGLRKCNVFSISYATSPEYDIWIK